MIGHDIAKEAIEGRYDIVTEMIGEVPDDIVAVSAAMRKAGYRIQAECLTCDIAVALERNLQRGPDNISAYFTQHFHQKWLITAANEFSRTQCGPDNAFHRYEVIPPDTLLLPTFAKNSHRCNLTSRNASETYAAPCYTRPDWGSNCASAKFIACVYQVLRGSIMDWVASLVLLLMRKRPIHDYLTR